MLQRIATMGLISSCLLAPGMSIAAVGASAPSAQMSAEQIVERNVVARGGVAAWGRVHSLRMEGKLDAGKRRTDGDRLAAMNRKRLTRAEQRAFVRKAVLEQNQPGHDQMIQLPFKIELKRPHKSRMEIAFRGDTALQIYDGSQGWKLRPYLGRREVEAFTPEEAQAAAQQQELDGYLIDHESKGTRVALAGSEKVEGRECYKLKLTLKSGEIRHLWIDAKTFLEAKVEGVPRKLDGRLHPVATYLSDYRSVGGLVIPHLLSTQVEGVRDGERIIVEQVALNPDLGDDLFAKPRP